MTNIVFIWNKVQFSGVITNQEPSAIQGQKTEITTFFPVTQKFTLFGKVQVGNCGPFTVISIEEPIVHKTDGSCVWSNLVYPLDKGYLYDAQLDDKWVEQKLKSKFGRAIITISDKYVVELESNSGKKLLVVNHDSKYYLISKSYKS